MATAEPLVVAEDLQPVLRQVIRPDAPDEGEAVQRLSERAEVSTRTVYRILRPAPSRSGRPRTVSLARADRLVLAIGQHLAEIAPRLLLPDGSVVEYADA